MDSRVQFFVLLVLVNFVRCTVALVDHYAISTSLATSSPVDHWATFDTTYGNLSSASYYDDNTNLDPIDFCMPFFQLPNARMYISSNGFLSPAPFALCKYFCSSYADGDYQFNNWGDGGDWPLVGLFVDDMNPLSTVSPASSGIFKRTGQKVVLGEVVDMALVSFVKVPPYSSTPNQVASLTAQVELWANGTIIMRYKGMADSPTGYTSIGLIWTKLQRAVPTWDNLTLPFAIRYDPVPSSCAAKATCSSCIAESTCAWCPGRCVPSAFATDFCPRGDINSCNVTVGAPQVFYNTSVWTQNGSAGTGARWTSIAAAPQVETLGLSNFTFSAPLNFSFPFFYNPPHWVPNNVSFASTAYVDVMQYISLQKGQPLCGYCPSSTCWQICSNAILPLVSRNGYVNGSTTTLVALFPPRAGGSSSWFCSEANCPSTLVVETSGLENYWGTGASFSFQILIFANGSFQLRYNSSFDSSMFPSLSSMTSQCSSESVYAQYPPPTIGIVHASPSDPSSPLFSWSTLRDGTVLAFDPVPGCVDCNNRGSCNLTSRQCVCSSPFTGANCSLCVQGYYGSSCTRCPICFHGGTCADGVGGSGSCQCSGPWSGQFCNVSCPLGQPTNCSGCNTFGGYCECGQCKCLAMVGYFGPQCLNWSDPCSRYSLDQCPTCTASNPQCRYCASSYQCITDPNVVIYANVNRSSSCGVLYAAANGNCIAIPQPSNPDQGVAVIIVIIIFGGIAFCSCFVIVLVCVCRRPNSNALVSGAVMGTPDFQFPRREREVVQMVLLKPTGKGGRPVQGIPLQQIPLKELYELQYKPAATSGLGNSSTTLRQRSVSQAREML